MRWSLAALFTLIGCMAASTSVVAVGVGAYNRANGQCFAPCIDGTACNKTTGTCDPIPCRGRCATNEICEPNGLTDRCVPAAKGNLQLVPK